MFQSESAGSNSEVNMTVVVNKFIPNKSQVLSYTMLKRKCKANLIEYWVLTHAFSKVLSIPGRLICSLLIKSWIGRKILVKYIFIAFAEFYTFVLLPLLQHK